MNDVRRWLDSLGLSGYSDAFEENAVEWRHLSMLDHDALKELGVRALGHRLTLLEAIRSLDDGAEDEASPAPAAPTRPDAQIGTAERRQLTVMFCDLVGSVELGERMDVEDYRDLLSRFRGAVVEAVQRNGGFVARHQGDGLLAYFGYPHADENDAERAVRTGLDIVGAIERLEQPYEVSTSVRVGIATGSAVVGDLLETGGSNELAALGQTPNLAARLQGEALPNSVVISQTTQALTAGLFKLDALPAKALKGISEAVTAYSVRAEVRGQLRFAARAGTHLSPFVGRDEELEVLARRWSRAKWGHGQVVLAIGEAGIGKSRLLQQLRERIDCEPHESIYLQCSPHHEGSALYPVVVGFEQALGFADIPEKIGRLEGLQHHLNEIGQIGEEALGLLARLLSIRSERPFPTVEMMDASQRRERTLEALLGYVRKRAEKFPLLCVFEDVHWADPTTRELLERLAEDLYDAAVLLVTTSRPGFEAGWTDLAQAHVLSLSRLGPEAGEQLAHGVASTMVELPVEVVRTIVSRAGGNPLFIEELTRTMIRKRGGSQEDVRAAIPATLQDSLMARLDSLRDGKAVAQCASVIGREFELALLEQVWEGSSTDLSVGVAELEEDGLIYRRSEGGEARYRFRHALIQEAAYAALLRDTRRQLQERTALALRQRSAPAELLAHHCMEAELFADAVEQWQLAARNAFAGSAHEEAIGHLRAALQALEHLPRGEDRDRAELTVRIELGRTLMATRGYGAPEVRETYERARTLSRMLGDVGQGFNVARGLGSHHIARAEYQEAAAYGEECLRLAEREESEPWLVRAHLTLGTVQAWTGAVTKAHASLTQAVEVAKVQRPGVELVGRTEDPEVLATAIDGMALGMMGYLVQARSALDEAKALADSLSHPLSRAAANGVTAFHLLTSRQYESVDGPARTALEIAEEHRFSLWMWNAMVFRGCAVAKSRGDIDALAEARAGIELCRASGSPYMLPVYLTQLAGGLSACGELHEALRAVTEAVEVAKRTGEHCYLPEAMRLRAGLRLLCGYAQKRETESHLMEALHLAQGLELRFFELQTAVSIAKLLSDEDRRLEAYEALSPIYEWFTEGHETPLLQEAADLLLELS